MTKIAFLTASEGIERVELTDPWKAVTDAGYTAELLSPEAGEVQLADHLDPAGTQKVETTVADANVDDYAALVLPGGEWTDEEVVVDGNLITSRNPNDLPAFDKALLDALS